MLRVMPSSLPIFKLIRQLPHLPPIKLILTGTSVCDDNRRPGTAEFRGTKAKLIAAETVALDDRQMRRRLGQSCRFGQSMVDRFFSGKGSRDVLRGFL